METHGGKTWTGGKSQLSTRLAKMNDDGIIYFDASKRDTKTKTNLTMWCFESLDEGRKRWDRKFNDGEDSFHGAKDDSSITPITPTFPRSGKTIGVR